MNRLILLSWLFLGSANAATGYQVGFATRNVTPPVESLSSGETYMGGYGLWTARGAAESVHDLLQANAMCIVDSEQGLCIVIVDSLGLPGPIVDRITDRVSAQTGLNGDHVFVGATHTHAAPDLLGLWGGCPERYAEYLIQKTADAVVTAFRNVKPADLFYASGKGKAHNRRGWGYTDDAIVVLEAVSEQGNTSGIFVNFAAHPTISTSENLSLSSDYVHYLRQRIREISKASVVFANGAIGDVTPLAERQADMWASAKTYGEFIADKAIDALSDKRGVGPGIEVKRQRLNIEVENTVLALAQSFGVVDDYSSGPFWDVTVQSNAGHFSLGQEVEAVAVPGEALTRMGLAVKEDMQAPAKIVLGLTGGSLGYFIPRDEWETGRNDNYEESVSLGPHVADQIQQILRELSKP